MSYSYLTLLAIGCSFIVNQIFSQSVGIGTTQFVPLNTLDVAGNAVIGTGYAGINTSPTNGLLVQGFVGIGSISPTEPLNINYLPAANVSFDAVSITYKPKTNTLTAGIMMWYTPKPSATGLTNSGY